MRISVIITAALLLSTLNLALAQARPAPGAEHAPATATANVPPTPPKPEPPKPENPKTAGTNSQIQIVYQPSDIVTDGSESDAKTTFAIRALANGLKGPRIVSGSLRDDDSYEQLPTDAFDLVRDDGKGADAEIPGNDLTRLSIHLKNDWRRSGRYSGSLWIGATGDSGAQSVAFKVYIRPHSVWFLGFAVIATGAGISWFTLFWVSRQRQLAGNQVLIARLQTVVDGLTQTLQGIGKAGAPATPQSLAHLARIKSDRLAQLMHDKELSVIAGVSVPPTDSPSVIDEVEGMNRIVQNGFVQLFQLWNASGSNRPNLIPLFQQMDNLGSIAQPLNTLDASIQTILAKSTVPTARASIDGHFTPLPSENSVVHRVVTTTYLLDLLSVATVVVAGMFVLIWKNPGFGTIGNYIEAFLWGLGLKLGSDLTKLGPGDVRTSFGIKTPAP
ncbi:MAG TPA: hypothetical protein VNZ03_34825 [Terriglobales bacterium]|jgi:hypothetical protein|nr:hypothetical protein [Terriglobales bacterium]